MSQKVNANLVKDFNEGYNQCIKALNYMMAEFKKVKK